MANTEARGRAYRAAPARTLVRHWSGLSGRDDVGARWSEGVALGLGWACPFGAGSVAFNKRDYK